jgi:hypothetical protein
MPALIYKTAARASRHGHTGKFLARATGGLLVNQLEITWRLSCQWLDMTQPEASSWMHKHRCSDLQIQVALPTFELTPSRTSLPWPWNQSLEHIKPRHGCYFDTSRYVVLDCLVRKKPRLLYKTYLFTWKHHAKRCQNLENWAIISKPGI